LFAGKMPAECLVAAATATTTTVAATAAAASTTAAAAAAVTAATATAAAASTAAAAAVTAATTTTSAATEATATGRTWLHGASLVHHETTAAVLLAVHAINGRLRFRVAAHLDKTEAFGAAGVAFHHDLGA
jgi:hypothetical protein